MTKPLQDLMSIAKESTSPDELRILSKHDNWIIRVLVAANAKCPADTIFCLGDDSTPAVLKAICSRADTSNDYLNKMTRHCDSEVRMALIDKMDLPTLIWHVSTLRQKLDLAKTVKQIVVHFDAPETSLALLNSAAEDQNPDVRTAVASSCRTSLDILKRLANDSSRKVCSAVASNASTTMEVSLALKENLKNRNWPVTTDSLPLLSEPERVEIARMAHSDFSRSVAILLLNDSSIDVYQAVSKNPRLPEEFRRDIKNSGSEKFTSEMLKQFSESPIKRLRIVPAKHPLTTPDVLAELAHSRDIKVRCAVACHNNTPPKTLEHLANSDRKVKRNVAKNKNTPTHILEQLAEVPDVKIQLRLAANGNTPAHVLEKFVAVPNVEIWIRLAANGNTPSHILEQLAEAPIVEIQLRLATHKNTPTHILEQLVENPDVDVRRRLATRKNTPTHILEQLAKVPDFETLLRLATQQKNIPTHILEQLPKVPDVEIQRRLATHKNTPTHILEQLAEVPDVKIKRGLAKNKNTPTHVLEQLAEDPDFEIRLNIAKRCVMFKTAILPLYWGVEDAIVKLVFGNLPGWQVQCPNHLLGLGEILEGISSETSQWFCAIVEDDGAIYFCNWGPAIGDSAITIYNNGRRKVLSASICKILMATNIVITPRFPYSVADMDLRKIKPDSSWAAINNLGLINVKDVQLIDLSIASSAFVFSR